MPRTLPAALTTVMDAGIYEPYLRVMINSDPTDTGAVTVQPLAFKLEALKATVKVPFVSGDTAEMEYFRIIRGAVINGTPSTISSIWFKTIEFPYDGKYQTLIGEVFPREYLTIAANSDYETVIETALTRDTDTIVPSFEGTAAWKAYQFYPTGKTIVLSPIQKLFTILRQKYLVFAAEDGYDGANNNMFFFVAPQARTTDYTFVDVLFNGNERFENRKLIFRDEASTIHSQGAATLPIHNLGFLPSTADFPDANPLNTFVGGRSSKLPVHLKYRTGDWAICIGDGIGSNGINARINVIEVLDLESTPAWYQIIETLVWFGTTEGGAMPSTIEAAAPYTPLVTGNFDGTLTANDNNLQAAMETLDDHAHAATYQPLDSDLTAIAALSPANDDIIQRKAGAWTNRTLAQLITDLTEAIQDLVGAMTTGNTETGITVTYQDSDGTIDFEAGKSLVAFPCHGQNGTVPAAGSRYLPPFLYGLNATAYAFIAPTDMVLSNLFIRTNGAQPAGGSLVVTVQTGTPLANSALTITIAAGAAAGDFSDTTHTVSITAGTAVIVQAVNNAGGAASALIGTCTFVGRAALE